MVLPRMRLGRGAIAVATSSRAFVPPVSLVVLPYDQRAPTRVTVVVCECPTP